MHRAFRKSEKLMYGGDVVPEDGHVGSFDGGAVFGTGEDDADIGSRERRRVVQSVADHRDRFAARSRFVHDAIFFFGCAVGIDLELDAGEYRFGIFLAIAGKYGNLETSVFEINQKFLCVIFEYVSEVERRKVISVFG